MANQRFGEYRHTDFAENAAKAEAAEKAKAEAAENERPRNKILEAMTDAKVPEGGKRWETFNERTTRAFESGKKVIGEQASRFGRLMNTLGSRVGTGVETRTTAAAEQATEQPVAEQAVEAANSNEGQLSKKEARERFVQEGIAVAEIIGGAIKNKTGELLKSGWNALKNRFNKIRNWGKETVEGAQAAYLNVKEQARDRVTAKRVEKARAMAEAHAQQEAYQAGEKQKWEAVAAQEILRRTKEKNALRAKYAGRSLALAQAA